ncbi:MAG: aldehyde dehydrogenase [Sphingomonadaceae bacterium]|nr:aldehyde dehydrogenase [Sphingomonadaceae bacterium]
MHLKPFSEVTLNFLARDHKLFIGGKWRPGQSDRIIGVENPAREEIVAHVRAASADDLDAAVSAARAALDGPWSRMPPAERARLLFRLADLMERHAIKLAELSTIENGMPLWMAHAKMEGFCPELIRYYAGWTTKYGGDTLPAVPIRGEADDWTVFTLKQPVGVVGAIIPWNSPAAMITLKTAPALAAGCTLVMKPAELTPLLATRFTELIEEAGFPSGVFNLVQGYGDDIGSGIASHPGIDKVAFTGSTEVGKAIVRAASNDLKKVSLELGGKSPFIVCADADIDKAVPGAAAACFFLSGQNCMAGTRLFVEESIADEFLSGLVEVSKNYVVGDGMQEGTLIGPVISGKQRERIRAFVLEAEESGATKLFEGDCPDGTGHFVAPTIFSDVAADMRIAREEVFGPVLAVQRFAQNDEAELLARVNGTHFALSGSVWTRDISRALRLAKKIDSGQVGINAHAAISPETPFGGNRQSGWGREFGREGLDAYFKTKAISMNLGPHT